MTCFHLIGFMLQGFIKFEITRSHFYNLSWLDFIFKCAQEYSHIYVMVISKVKEIL